MDLRLFFIHHPRLVSPCTIWSILEGYGLGDARECKDCLVRHGEPELVGFYDMCRRSRAQLQAASSLATKSSPIGFVLFALRE